MHDPLVVAFTVRRPWPQRSTLPAPQNGKRWAFLLHHEHHEPYCTEHNCTGNPFPWWKPRSWSSFQRITGRDIYWPPLITVWHREPGGHDSGEVCKHYRRVYDEATRTWGTKWVNGWRWHFWHWRVQIHPLQALRRWALTRCAWCGGRSRKGDYVNVSHSWDGPRGHWWQGAPGVFHNDCSSVEHAHSLCLCGVPLIPAGRTYGTCGACGKFRPYGYAPDEADLLLASLPARSRITPGVRPAVDAAWADRRARTMTAPSHDPAADARAWNSRAIEGLDGKIRADERARIRSAAIRAAAPMHSTTFQPTVLTAVPPETLLRLLDSEPPEAPVPVTASVIIVRFPDGSFERVRADSFSVDDDKNLAVCAGGRQVAWFPAGSHAGAYEEPDDLPVATAPRGA